LSVHSQIELDLNHELAGKALTFEVELLELTPSERMQKATFGAGACSTTVRAMGVAYTSVHQLAQQPQKEQ